MIETWLSKQENLEYYYFCLDEWERMNLQFLPDEATAYENFLVASSSINPEIKKKVEKPFLIRFFFNKKVAIASIAILVLSSGFLFSKDYLFIKTVSTAFSETKKVILPDGSIVTLNANSKLTFSRFGFGSKNREVHLVGEADFSVRHTYDNKQFLVNTDNGIQIKVLGTEFTAYARDAARVVLKSGKIELKYLDGNGSSKITMKPGDLFDNFKKQIHVGHVSHPETFSAWKNHEFIFDNTSLSEIGKMFKENYNITIQFETKELAERRISGSFHAENEEELLNAISQLLDINYKYKQGSLIYFFD